MYYMYYVLTEKTFQCMLLLDEEQDVVCDPVRRDNQKEYVSQID